MTDKLVTHDDRQPIADLRHWIAALPDHPWTDARRAHLLDTLDRLIEAAEADRPPLPEGWVIYTDSVGVQRILWHEGGKFYNWSDCSHEFTINANHRSLTPLRPTVTEADVEKAALCYYDDDGEGLAEWPEWSGPSSRQHCKQRARAVLAAAGIEVRDVN